MTDSLTQHDDRLRRCPALGHEVPFSYCRAPGRDLPCRKIFDCWWETFDVAAFMKQHYTPEQLQQITAPPPSKASSLIDLIRRAQAGGQES
jgi:hypothetical protein